MTAFLGILALDTAFPRILGDAGNVLSYGFPARVEIVSGVGSLAVVKDSEMRAEQVQSTCEAARTLEAEGAVAIISTCGFLITVQAQIAEAVNIPVIVSALSLFPIVQAASGGKPVGILTASKRSLGARALAAANIPPADVRIEGLENCTAFASAILSEKSQQTGFDAQGIEQAAVEKALKLLEDTPEMAAILLECGNLPPYAPAIRAATGLPVFSILQAAELLWSGAVP